MPKLRIFANGLNHWYREIAKALDDQLDSLGSARGLIETVEDDGSVLDPGELAVFFSDDTSLGQRVEEDVSQRLQGHLEVGGSVIPVLDELKAATQKLPPVLTNYNAYPVGTQNPRQYGRLIDEILSRLWWRRRIRRLFLSYKRSDSSAIAYQLREELTRRGYQVFLDECTLAPGDDAQREIMSWLTDADFVLLLCSPNLGESQWVIKEIATANTVELPVLGVVWPNTTPPGALWIDSKYPLSKGDLEGSNPAAQLLTSSVCLDLLEKIEAYRAKAIYKRLENLLPFLRFGLAPRFEIRDGESLGDLEIADPSNPSSCFIRVLPFRPSLAELHNLAQDVSERFPTPERAYVFYAENDLEDPARLALEWALEPDRPSPPRRFQILSYLNGEPELGDLAR